MSPEECERETESYSFDVGRFTIRSVLDEDCDIAYYSVYLDDAGRKIASFKERKEAIAFAQEWMQRLVEIEEKINEDVEKRISKHKKK